MENLELLIDLHKSQNRQGPGSEKETHKALSLAMLDKTSQLKIADIGCGTGASTIFLAKQLNARITAVDFLPEFIEVLKEASNKNGLEKKISPIVCNMETLPFSEEEYDVIWSEGAIYNIGFERGIKEWRHFLKPGGTLVVSELTWTTNNRPNEIEAYWRNEYPEITTASSKIKILEQNGYSLSAYFLLPEDCWIENYYRPLQNSFTTFINRNNFSQKPKRFSGMKKLKLLFMKNTNLITAMECISQKRCKIHKLLLKPQPLTIWGFFIPL